MAAKLVVPRSQEGAFIWRLFAGFDHVDHDERTTVFIDQLVASIDVDAGDRARVVRALRERLPDTVGQIAPAEVAEVLEEIGVLAWIEDRREVGSAVVGALATAIRAVVRDAPRGATPRPVADALIVATRNVLGDAMLDATMTTALHAAFTRELEADLWRRDEVMDRLVARLENKIETVARLKIA
jgi:hypothetical protein